MGPMETSLRTTKVSMMAMWSCGRSRSRAKEAEDASLAGETGRGPWRHADPDLGSLPHSRRRPRDVPDARVREHRDRVRCEPVGRLAPGAMVDGPRAADRDGGPPAARM